MDTIPDAFHFSRRHFFRGAALLAVPSGLQVLTSTAAAQQQPPEDAGQLTTYHEAEIGGRRRSPHIWLRWDNTPLTSYRAHPTQKYPYSYPLAGPASGLSLTEESALPWPHHRSLCFSTDRLNRANYWQQGLEHGQVISMGPSVRCATDISPWGGGMLRSSEGGVGEAQTFGKPALWCAFYGRRGTGALGTMEGIALFDHPTNPWNPCPWFTRDYGLISPMPFQWITEPWQLAAGKSVRLKYKVIAFAGDHEEAYLDRQHAQWLAQTGTPNQG